MMNLQYSSDGKLKCCHAQPSKRLRSGSKKTNRSRRFEAASISSVKILTFKENAKGTAQQETSSWWLGVDRTYIRWIGSKDARRYKHELPWHVPRVILLLFADVVISLSLICAWINRYFSLLPLAETEPHEGKRKTESLWPIYRYCCNCLEAIASNLYKFCWNLSDFWCFWLKHFIAIKDVALLCKFITESIIKSPAMFMIFFTEEKQLVEVSTTVIMILLSYPF